MHKGSSRCKKRRQLLDNNLKSIGSLTSRCGINTIDISSPNAFHGKYFIQTDYVDIEFSKVFTEYIKNAQHQNSRRANSVFTNDVFSYIYSYLSILELKESQDDLPTPTSRHILSKLLNAISENLTSNDIIQHVKQGLQKFLAWFVIDYFVHNIDLIEQARKTFRTQNTDDETLLAEQTDYV